MTTNINIDSKIIDSAIFGQAMDLSARFHKVLISTKMPGMTKTIKGLVSELEIKNGATVGASLKETGPKLYADSPLWVAVKKAKNQVTSTHTKLTSVWDESGWRLLSTAKWTEYHSTIQPLITIFNAAADSLAWEFDHMIIEAQGRLGSLFSRDDYPVDQNAFRECMKINPRNETVPQIDDAKRLGTVLPVEEIEAMRRDMQSAYTDNLERINTQNFELLYTHTAKLAKSLVAWSAGEQTSIKKTLLDEIERACQFCTQFNASGDPRLTRLVEDVRNSLLTVDMTEIRENPIVCASVIKSATSARDAAIAAMNSKGAGFGARAALN